LLAAHLTSPIFDTHPLIVSSALLASLIVRSRASSVITIGTCLPVMREACILGLLGMGLFWDQTGLISRRFSLRLSLSHLSLRSEYSISAGLLMF
jgi:hypothetical protein